MPPALSLRRLLRRRPAPPPRYPLDAMRAMTAADWQALLSGPLEAALPRIEAAARDGIVEAMLALGQVLLDRQDPAGAAAWFGAAAGSGNAMGLNMLGRCHELGWGMAADPVRARALYARAARMGLDWAQFNLGMAQLRAGEASEARSAFAAAAAQGHAKAMNMLGMLEERAGRPAAALDWYRAAAEGGDFRGQFNLGSALAQAGDIAAARSWLACALASGNPDVLAGLEAMKDHADPRLRALAAEASLRRRGAACC